MHLTSALTAAGRVGEEPWADRPLVPLAGISAHRPGYDGPEWVSELGILLRSGYAHYPLASRSRRHHARRGPFPASIPVYSRYLLSSRSRVRIALGALLLP
jgi:hypothetical protein